MMHDQSLVLVLLIPLVSSLTPLAAHRNLHAAESVRLLRANETVHSTGSDLVFSWVKCVICDGYDARLYLQDISGTRMIPHQLKAAVTSLKITDVPPRTVYKFVVKRFPSDQYSSEVSGRSFSQNAPLAVENLAARALTSSSIQIEWNSQNADGFVARILENATVIQEKNIPDFSNHSIVNITNLKPDTDYQVQVTAFYFPPAGNSISPVSSVQVSTLPVSLPELHLTWEFDSEVRLHWKNPQKPSPVVHRLNCTRDSASIFAARLGGATDFLAITNVSDSTEIDCLLETWFSVDDRAKVLSRVTAFKSERSDSTFTDKFYCSYWNNHPSIKTSVEMLPGVIGSTTAFTLRFSHMQEGSQYLDFQELHYRICEQNGFCDPSWITLPEKESPLLRLEPGNLKAWHSYTIQYRFELRCSSSYDGRHFITSVRSSSYDGRHFFTPVRSVEVPGLTGPVEPVTQISATASMVSWNYSSRPPSYFLVTYCTENDCTSQSVPGKSRSMSLGKLEENSVYYVTIQAVQLRDSRAYVSPTEMTSIIAPKVEFSENVTLAYTEISNSSTVQLVIGYPDTSPGPAVVAYHLAVCSKPVPIWGDAALSNLLGSDETCESMVSTKPSIDLVREPWTAYEVSVVVCYGAFDSNLPANLTLPISKRNPRPLTGLSWTQENSVLSWKYSSPVPSGFSISICPPQHNTTDGCSDILAGPLDRQYHIDPSDLSDNGFVAFVTPFVMYEGVSYNGTRSEIAVSLRGAIQSGQP